MPNQSRTPEEQFVAYHNRLRGELDTAYEHYQIAKSLREFSQTRRSEFTEASAFFQLTIAANLFTTVMIINRAFIDQRDDCLQLHGFFKLIRNNLSLFSTSAFKKRLAEGTWSKGYIEDRIGSHVEITCKMVNDDETKLESLPIKHLKKWRNKMLAHRDKKLALKNIDVMKANPVTVKEIDDVLTTLDEILNRYVIAYDGGGYDIRSRHLESQIEDVMNAIRFYQQSREEQK